MTAPAGTIWPRHDARSPYVETPFGYGPADAVSRLVYEDRRVRVVELHAPAGARAELPARTSTGHHVVLTQRGAFGCDTGRALATAVTLDPAHALLLNPGDHFRLRRPATVGHVSTVVTLAPELAARLFDRGDARPNGDARRFRAGRVLLRGATLLRVHRHRRAWYAGEPGIALLETLADLVWAPDASPPLAPRDRGASRRHRGVAEAAKLILATAPAAVHRLEAVAGALGVSAYHLAHVFRGQVGMSMHRYLLQLRLAVALGELSTSDVHLSTLAFELGFSSHSHFTAVFARYLGVTPSEARARA